MHESDDLRYGVFLRPDARTSAAVTAITTFVRAQFGLVSAGAFPPHVTLAGSLPLAISEERLATLVADVAREFRPITVQNNGIARLGESVVFDIHHLDGSPNRALVELAARVNAVVRPVLRTATGLAPDVLDGDRWRGHLSLASHELAGQPELGAEVDAFIRDLPVPYPERFDVTTLTIYRLHNRHWRPGWWTTFRWERIGSVGLGDRDSPALGNG